MNINKNALIAVVLIAGPAFLIWPNSTGGAAIWTINGFLALIPSIKAARKGRDFIPWLVYSMVFWLIALIHSCIISDNDKAKQEKDGTSAHIVVNTVVQKLLSVIVVANH